MSDPTAYPLAWPIGWKRAPYRIRSRFGRSYTQKPSVADGVEFVERELDRLGAELICISTNLQPTLSGRPRANQATPSDPGVAVYFDLDGHQRVLACDAWDRIGCNLTAIGKHIEALRGMERWGVGNLEQAFTGYTGLPEHASELHWRTVLGFEDGEQVDESAVQRRYRASAIMKHPDRGGTHDDMARLNRARDQALRELSDGG